MIDAEVIEHLETEIDRLRTKYDPKTTADLERIAIDEYGVTKLIKTPLVYGVSTVIKDKNGLYIFYHVTFKPHEPLTLGHEIGHIAAGHFNGHRPKLSIREEEADYFSLGLNGVSLRRLKFYSFVDATASFKEDFLNLFRHKREVEKLMQMGVYHILK